MEETPWARWLARDPDPETRAELEALVAAGDVGELRARFAGRLEFGTAGLRGVVGAGPTRMNRVVIRETSAGLAAWVLEAQPDARARGVVVGFDGRLHSASFARECAATLAAAGLPVFLAAEGLPTPACAFAVTALGAAAGVVITASHNPPEYNGYKVFWRDGAQIIPPHDAGIVAAIEVAAQAPLPALALEHPLIQPLPGEVRERYLAGVAGLVGEQDREARAGLRIAYTPLHGVGARWTEAALAQAGFPQVHTVAAQREPDGHFPTVRFPNPEEPGAMDALLALAQAVGADLALANDPDADRLAAAAPDEGRWRVLTGNQIGALLGDQALAKAPREGASVGTTIVSSQLLGRMAEAAGVECYETLTGFKWIANGALAREARGGRFLFGYEEALGYTVGSLVRDKDGVSAAACFAALAASLRAQGETLWGRLRALYAAYGLFVTDQRSLPLRPGDAPLGQALRGAHITHIGGRAVTAYADLERQLKISGDATEALTLPQSDVQTWWLEGGARVIVRPSGTEPKVKCYYEVCGQWRDGEPFAEAEARAQAELSALMDAHQAELGALTAGQAQ
jgi:phosphomannomutase